MVLSSIFGLRSSGFFDAPAVEVLVPGGETHFGLSENEREETMLVPLFGCSKMDCDGLDLVDLVLNGVEGELSHNCIEPD